MNKEAYEVFELGESCWRIEENGVRAFLLAGKERAVLIDSGFGTGNIKAVVQKLTGLPLILINTHADRDHIGNNALFDEVYMHPSEFDRYHRGQGKGLYARPLWEGERISLGGRSLEVIFIPGHTPGSIALLDEENRVLFSGDSAQAGLIYMFGPGRDIDAYIASMEKLQRMSGRFDTLYASHGPIPVKSDILPALIEGAKRMRDGVIQGEPAPANINADAKVYDVGVAKFLYD